MAEHTDNSSAPLIGRLEAVTAISVVGLLALVIGLVAFAVPATKGSTARIGYQQDGAFSYRGATPSGSIYGATGVTSGEPIAINIVKVVDARFTYRLTSPAAVSARGTQSLVAVVKLGSGLTRRFTVEPEQTFNGTTFTATGSLPTQSILQYVNASNAALSGTAPTAATVSVVAQIKAAGRVGTRPFTTSYSPSLPFTLTGSTLTLSQPSTTSSVVHIGSAADAALKPSRGGSVSYRSNTAGTMPLLVAHPSVTVTREVAIGLALLCLVLALMVGRPLTRGGTPSNERDRVRALYGSLLVPVRDLATPGAAIAEVATMGSLAEVAKRYEAMIMHHRRDDGDDYMVWDNGMLYRHTIGAPQPSPVAASPFRATLTASKSFPAASPSRATTSSRAAVAPRRGPNPAGRRAADSPLRHAPSTDHGASA
jgi:hypothetical protein